MLKFVYDHIQHDLKKFSENIIRLRGIHGWSQEELADQSGVSRGLIAKYENPKDLEKRQPDVYRVFAIARAFGVSVEEILFGTPNSISDLTYESYFKESLNLPVADKALILEQIIFRLKKRDEQRYALVHQNIDMIKNRPTNSTIDQY